MTFTLTREAFDVLALELKGTDVDLHNDYIGRGMWPVDTCLAISCHDLSGLITFLFTITDLATNVDDDVTNPIGELADVLRTGRTSTDQLGLGMVYYWPHVNVAV